MPRRERPVHTLKRALLWLGVAFVVYTVIVAPDTAAQAFSEAVDGLLTAARSLGDFFDALIT